MRSVFIENIQIILIRKQMEGGRGRGGREEGEQQANIPSTISAQWSAACVFSP